MYTEATGKLEEKISFEEIETYWEIPNFFSSPDNSDYFAPDFKFLNISWKLSTTCCSSDGIKSDYLDLRLKMDHVESSFNVLCVFGIKNVDGSLTNITSLKHNFSIYNKLLKVPKFCSRSALIERKSEHMLSNDLIILCKLKHIGNSMKLTEMVTFSENIKSLFIKEEFCDIILHVKDKKFKAHKMILAARSPVFAAMLKHEMSENQTGLITITDCDPVPFQMFLEYLYCGRLENLSFHSAFHLYKVADKYVVPELKMFCVEYMGQIMKVENVCDVVVLAEECDDKKLFALGQKFFNRNLKEIFASTEWKDLFQKNFTLANKLLLEMATEVKIY